MKTKLPNDKKPLVENITLSTWAGLKQILSYGLMLFIAIVIGFGWVKYQKHTRQASQFPPIDITQILANNLAETEFKEISMYDRGEWFTQKFHVMKNNQANFELSQFEQHLHQSNFYPTNARYIGDKTYCVDKNNAISFPNLINNSHIDKLDFIEITYDFNKSGIKECENGF